MKRYAYLVCVDALHNNNKFYEMTLNDDMSIDVNYGRVGGNVTRHHYTPNEKDWRTLLDSKLNKGYSDQTALRSVIDNSKQQNPDLQYAPIENDEIKNLIERLVSTSREFMKKNYTIKATDITQKMVDEASRDIALLSQIAATADNNSLWRFNDVLNELFADIPRKMSKVDLYLAHSTADFQKIIDREQDMLDNIKGQLIRNTPIQPTQSEKNGTVLEAYNLTVKELSYKQEDEILTHLGNDYNGAQVERRFVKGYAVENENTRAAYEQYKTDHNLTPRDCRLFYHGSRTENWFSIMKQGLSLNPNAVITAKMFGNGIYFAPDARKSLNYMDVSGAHWNNGTAHTGFLAVYSVALGKCYKPTGALGSGFQKKDLPKDCLSVYADKNITGLVNDEYVVYDQEQCTIKYLLEMTEPNVRNLSFTLDRNLLRNKLDPAFGNVERVQNETLRVEFSPASLDSNAANEVVDKIFGGESVKKAYIYYDTQRDRISIKLDRYDDKTPQYQSTLTNDDYAFLSREMKKSFATRESEWKEIVEQSTNYKIGDIAAKKLSEQEKKPQKHISKQNHKPIAVDNR